MWKATFLLFVQPVLVLIVTTAGIATTASSQSLYPVKKFIFNSVVDHFNFKPTPKPSFPLRYYVNDDYWKQSTEDDGDGAVFFYAGNEADILQFVNNSGFIFEAAKEFKALVVFAEHRYYGESLILSSSTHATDSDEENPYQYLTVEQAMEDFNTLNVHLRQTALFRRTTNSESATSTSSTNSIPFIVFGGSYGGNLAMWLRLKSPNLWAGAIASSATPLKHILRQTNAFHRIETDVYANASHHLYQQHDDQKQQQQQQQSKRSCPTLIRQGWKELFHNMTTPQGRNDVAATLGLCQVPWRPDMAHDIYGMISGALETMVQYGYPYPTSFYNPLPGYPFQVACQDMISSTSSTNNNTNSGAALRAAMNVYYNHTGQAGTCYDSVAREARTYWKRIGAHHHIQQQDEHIRALNDDSNPNKVGDSKTSRHRLRSMNKNNDQTAPDHDWYHGLYPKNDNNGDWQDPWGYQTCTEAYQPMPTDGITDFELPHTPNETAYFQSCRRRFGVVPRPNWEEMHFMGSDIGTGTNIFLASGQLDPWRAAGIQESPKGASSLSSIIIRIIEHGAHHYDLRESHPLDPPSVVKVRQEQKQAMRDWIADWKERHTL